MALTSTAGQSPSVAEAEVLEQGFLTCELGFEFCRQTACTQPKGHFVGAQNRGLFGAPCDQFMGELDGSHHGDPVERRGTAGFPNLSHPGIHLANRGQQ